jgi:hypothetical protein
MLDQELLKLIENDDSGLLDIEPKTKLVTSNDRLVESFLEINNFYKENNTEPVIGKDIQQMKLAMRLVGFREDIKKKEELKNYDEFNLLSSKKENQESSEIDSLKDLLVDDDLGLLDMSDTSIFQIKNVPKYEERKEAEFVARRQPCKDFKLFENLFIKIQSDLKNKLLILKKFDHGDIKHNGFYILDGVLLFVDTIIMDEEKDKNGKEDGRLRVIFENGTESGMRYRTLQKGLEIDGRTVMSADSNIVTNFISEADNESGYIYILKSLSKNPEIQGVKDLYKIGFCTTSVEERIKNAKEDPTYLMAEVKIVATIKCFNMNTQKLERLLHRFFADTCLNIDITDNHQNRYTPKEWFIAPIEIIEQAVNLIISGEIVGFRYDKEIKIIEKNK